MRKILKYLLFASLSIFLNCEKVILEDDISKSQITLIAPQDNSEFNSTSVTFNWGEVQYAKKYRLQIAKPNFSTPAQILVDTEITTTSYTSQLGLGTYQWRVQAISGNTSTAFATRTISILSNQNFQNNIVSLSSPVDNFASNVTNQNFTWQNISGATDYQFQIVDNSNTLINNQNTVSTSLNYTLPQGAYIWKVRATNGTDFTLYSSRNIIIDTTLPNVPTLNLPTNNTTTSNTTVSFQWSRVNIPGSTEFDKISIYKDAALTNLYQETQASSPYSVTLPQGTYYWYVKGYDAAGNQSAKSSVFILVVN